MRRQYHYVMRDQVRNRVSAIMGHNLRRAGVGTGGMLERSVWVLLVALAAAYSAALTLSGPTAG